MKGILYVDLPESCKGCSYFKTILDSPLVIRYSDGSTEIVSGACACMLDDKHRLKPLDNGQIMEQITIPIKELGQLHTESKIHTGRPEWCQIREEL